MALKVVLALLRKEYGVRFGSRVLRRNRFGLMDRK
jgi:hypothetical protein